MNIKTVIKDFKLLENAKNAKAMKAYMKDRFDYFGVKSTERRLLAKPHIKNAQLLDKGAVKKIASDLYQKPQRELHYVALEICIPYFKKHSNINDIEFFEFLATQNQWWDSIDVIAPKLMANYFLIFPENRDFYIDKWLQSNDKWLIRCALLFQLKYKAKTDLSLLFETILRIPPTKEFFINKAIGWVLRENSRLFPEAVIDFVNDNSATLSNLSKKEALRLLK